MKKTADIPDVCIIGAGLAGGLLAWELSRRGASVAVLEAGPRFDQEERWAAMDRRLRSGGRAWPVDEGRDAFTNAGPIAYPLNDFRVKGVGGTTLHWTALTHRFHESDFRLRSLHGQGVDWPMSYDELEPFYGAAEAALGVAGEADNPFASRRSAAYPLPAFPFSYGDRFFIDGCGALDIAVHHAPFARNSIPHDGRPACQAFATCASDHICPIVAQYTSEAHIGLAEKSGRATLLSDTCVRRLEVDGAGRVRQALFTGADGSEGAQSARVFVVAAHAVESARLLLLSRSGNFPDGLANGSGAVGRYFTDHPMVYAGGWLRQPAFPYRIGFHTAETHKFCNDERRGERGAFRLAFPNGAGPPPAELAAASGRWGAALAAEVRESFGRAVSVHGFLEPLLDEVNRVTLDPQRTDRFGDPVPRLDWRLGEFGARTAAAARAVMSDILAAAGAERTYASADGEALFCGHQIGTCRAGDDAETSVVNRDLRAHAVENLYVVGSSVFPTAGPLNPSLTIAALSLRLAQHLLNR